MMTAVNPIGSKSARKAQGRIEPFAFTAMGEPASKANSRRHVTRVSKNGNRFSASIKSKKALSYSDAFIMQCPVLPELFLDDVVVMFEIFYASRRPDLDESLILDLMQKRIYENDRQVKARFTVWGLDQANPRTTIHVAPLAGGSCSVDLRRDVWERLTEAGRG